MRINKHLIRKAKRRLEIIQLMREIEELESIKPPKLIWGDGFHIESIQIDKKAWELLEKYVSRG